MIRSSHLHTVKLKLVISEVDFSFLNLKNSFFIEQSGKFVSHQNIVSAVRASEEFSLFLGTCCSADGLKLLLFPGSHGLQQGGASWPMENYFQAEAFNLDKVLDEFEQNEGEPSAVEVDWEGLCDEGRGWTLRRHAGSLHPSGWSIIYIRWLRAGGRGMRLIGFFVASGIV